MNKSELVVYKDLVYRGFSVSNPNKTGHENGIDLIAMKNGYAFSIEVKSITVGKKAKTIKPIQKSGKACDWIALVLGSEIIYQPMSEHLKLCGPSGSRGVTELLQLRKMILAGIETGDVK